MTKATPPVNVGIKEAAIGDVVRYWPLTRFTCTPITGKVKRVGHHYGYLVVWLQGLSGFVAASHCELVTPTTKKD